MSIKLNQSIYMVNQVTYTVDGSSGYVATVEYSGEAVFPV